MLIVAKIIITSSVLFLIWVWWRGRKPQVRIEFKEEGKVVVLDRFEEESWHREIEHLN